MKFCFAMKKKLSSFHCEQNSCQGSVYMTFNTQNENSLLSNWPQWNHTRNEFHFVVFHANTYERLTRHFVENISFHSKWNLLKIKSHISTLYLLGLFWYTLFLVTSFYNLFHWTFFSKMTYDFAWNYQLKWQCDSSSVHYFLSIVPVDSCH